MSLNDFEVIDRLGKYKNSRTASIWNHDLELETWWNFTQINWSS